MIPGFPAKCNFTSLVLLFGKHTATAIKESSIPAPQTRTTLVGDVVVVKSIEAGKFWEVEAIPPASVFYVVSVVNRYGEADVWTEGFWELDDAKAAAQAAQDKQLDADADPEPLNWRRIYTVGNAWEAPSFDDEIYTISLITMKAKA